MRFRLDEEAGLTVADVAARVRGALDHETPYGRFGERFRRLTMTPPAAEAAAPAHPLGVAVSAELANALRGLHPRWGDRIDRVEPEGGDQQGAGILIRHPGGAPVIAAVEVDADAAEARGAARPSRCRRGRRRARRRRASDCARRPRRTAERPVGAG